MLLQIELHEFQWLNFDQGDHFGFTFSNEGVVSYDSDGSDNYCDGQVRVLWYLLVVMVSSVNLLSKLAIVVTKLSPWSYCFRSFSISVT